jgi:hypothetical protein
MKNLAFIVSVAGLLSLAAIATPARWSSADAASPARAAMVAAIPNPSPDIGGHPSNPMPPPPTPPPGLPPPLPPTPPPHVSTPQGAMPIIGFRRADFQNPAGAAVFGTTQVPSGISATTGPTGSVTIVGPGDQYVRFEYTVRVALPPNAPQADGGNYDVVLIKDPKTGSYCWVMDESRFAFKSITDYASGGPGTIAQRNGEGDLFVVTSYPVNTGYCRRQ